ncbi:MAG: hypothetical protein DRN12_05340 [Thermoplasmata archaeon]|nr:MAG: hypothetical protein DRN12_05340 [Thermoplasmata archaeon]
MSQHRRAMKIIEKESGLEGLVLRPLSARLLEPTLPEKSGLVDREKLLAITGRRRITQMKLAEEFNIKDYPCPAGGCRLTDPNFAERIRDAFQHGEDSLEELRLLRYGRHFRLPSGSKVVVGRNEMENQIIQRFAREEDILLEVVDTGSPITLLRKGKNRRDIEETGNLCIRYSDAKMHKKVKVKLRDAKGRVNKIVDFMKIDDAWHINSEIDFLDEIFLNYGGEENGREI